MDAMLSEAEVRNHVPITLSDVVLAERLRSQFAELTLFDSLHAATSKRVGIPVLSGDPTYKKIGVITMSLAERLKVPVDLVNVVALDSAGLSLAYRVLKEGRLAYCEDENFRRRWERETLRKVLDSDALRSLLKARRPLSK